MAGRINILPLLLLALTFAWPSAIPRQDGGVVDVTFEFTLAGEVPAGEHVGAFFEQIPPPVPQVSETGPLFFCGYSRNEGAYFPDTPDCRGSRMYRASARVTRGSDIRYAFVRQRDLDDRGRDDQVFGSDRVTADGPVIIRATYSYPSLGGESATPVPSTQPTPPTGEITLRFSLVLDDFAPERESFVLRYYGLDDSTLSSWAVFCGGDQEICAGGGAEHTRQLVLLRGTRLRYAFVRGELDQVVAGGGEVFAAGTVSPSSDLTVSARYPSADPPQLPNTGAGGATALR